MAGTEYSHRIIVGTVCRHTGAQCRSGADLMERLNEALARAGLAGDPRFRVEGAGCMAGCSRPRRVAFSASGRASYIFGDIEAGADIAALISFARPSGERANVITGRGSGRLNSWARYLPAFRLRSFKPKHPWSRYNEL